MKEFKKTEDGLFICEECSSVFETKAWLSRHIKVNHNLKNYFDKWIKEEKDDKCKICNKITNFKFSLDGYKNCCSKKCSKKLLQINNQEKYGVKNVFQAKIFKDKIKETNFRNCGYTNNLNSPEGIKSKKETWSQNYGVDNPLKSPIIYERLKRTNLERYGVEYSHQNLKILEKSQKSAKTLKKFRNTDLWYQGTYELDFLNRYYDKYPDLQRGPSIKYIYNGKNRVYHPDFYIPSLNLIVEIKSTWILNRDIEIEEKKKATITSGFKYIMILDKDYSDVYGVPIA